MSSNNKSIYVVGPPRSGSTLIYNILCSASNTNEAINETHVLPELARLYQLTINRIRLEQGHVFSDENEVKDLFSEYSDIFTKKLMNRYIEADILVIKSIAAANFGPALALLNPNQIYCVCVRDPRDIVASMLEVGIKQEKLGRQNQYPRNIDQLANIVISSYVPCLINTSSTFKKNSFVVEYKSLIEDFAKTISFMEEQTGLDLSGFEPTENWRHSKVDIEQRKKDSAPFYTEHWGKPITTSSLGSYKEKLSPGEISKIEKICRPIFELYSF